MVLFVRALPCKRRPNDSDKAFKSMAIAECYDECSARDIHTHSSFVEFCFSFWLTLQISLGICNKYGRIFADESHKAPSPFCCSFYFFVFVFLRVGQKFNLCKRTKKIDTEKGSNVFFWSNEFPIRTSRSQRFRKNCLASDLKKKKKYVCIREQVPCSVPEVIFFR